MCCISVSAIVEENESSNEIEGFYSRRLCLAKTRFSSTVGSSVSKEVSLLQKDQSLNLRKK